MPMRVLLARVVLVLVSSGTAGALQRGSAGSIDRYAWCHDKLLDCDSNIKTGCDSRYPNDPAGYKACMSDSYDFCNEAWGNGCISADVQGNFSSKPANKAKP